jgi:hypothetical protein
VQLGGNPPVLPETRPPWCTFEVCQAMPTEENKCCTETFQNTCADRDHVERGAISGQRSKTIQQTALETQHIASTFYGGVMVSIHGL